MKIATGDVTYSNHCASNQPSLTVQPGQEFIAHTQLNSGAWLNGPEDRYAYEKRTCSPNPVICVAVEGAVPGDAVVVRILEIVPDAVGYTGFDGRRENPLAPLIYPREWGLCTKTVSIRDGYIEWSDTLRLKTAPMLGTLGTAPARNESFLNTKAGPYGGNMDVQEVCAGASVWLPVNVRGALLHIGDAHAIQGDGEICSGGGVECRARARLKVELVKKPASMNWVRIENETHIGAICCHRSVNEAFHHATRELLNWMTEDYGFSLEDAYMLLGQVMEARATQFVNPGYTYICKISKKHLMR